MGYELIQVSPKHSGRPNINCQGSHHISSWLVWLQIYRVCSPRTSPSWTFSIPTMVSLWHSFSPLSHSSLLSIFQLVNVSNRHKEVLSSIINPQVSIDIPTLEIELIASLVADFVLSSVLVVNSRCRPTTHSFAWFFFLYHKQAIWVLATLWFPLKAWFTNQSFGNTQLPIQQSLVKSMGPGVLEAWLSH